MIRFQTESYATAKDDALLRMHFEELAQNKSQKRLNPDYATYDLLEASARLLCFSARDEDRVVGYCVFIISQHLHYSNDRIADNDVLYLHPDHRKGMTGIRLIKYAESELKKYGVDWVNWRVKYHLDFSPILYRLGYEDEEKVLTKRIGD